MKLRLAPPDTQMARNVLEFAQHAADVLDRTQFIVMERRTWERLMPSQPNLPDSDREAHATGDNPAETTGRPDADAPSPQATEACPKCAGKGTLMDFEYASRRCPACNGTGAKHAAPPAPGAGDGEVLLREARNMLHDCADGISNGVKADRLECFPYQPEVLDLVQRIDAHLRSHHQPQPATPAQGTK